MAAYLRTVLPLARPWLYTTVVGNGCVRTIELVQTAAWHTDTLTANLGQSSIHPISRPLLNSTRNTHLPNHPKRKYIHIFLNFIGKYITHVSNSAHYYINTSHTCNTINESVSSGQ